MAGDFGALMNADEVSCRIGAHQLAPATKGRVHPTTWVPRSRLGVSLSNPQARDLAIGGSMTSKRSDVKWEKKPKHLR